MRPIVLVSWSGLAEPTPSDALLLAALVRRGASAVSRAWDLPDLASPGDLLIIRSTWDYFRRYPEFLRWIDRLGSMAVEVWNALPLVRWNAHKGYLAELEGRGVPVVATEWVLPTDRRTLGEICGERGWDRVVVKPVVGGGAVGTWIGDASDAGAEARFDSQRADAELMVQPYLPAIVERGELSFIFLGGRFSHAVSKRPAVGDFRVQVEHGGSAQLVQPGADQIAVARNVLDHAPGLTLYARVDMVEIEPGRLELMELEVIEPELFFHLAPDGAERLADLLLERARGRS